MKLPNNYLDQMQKLLGDGLEGFLASYEDDRNYGLRMNRLKAHKGLEAALTYDLQEVLWCGDGFSYHGEARPAKDPYYAAGCYYIQEPSAMTPGAAIMAQQGDMIIDLCAAPGGKTTQMASDLLGTGLIVSNDISPSRVKNLNKNIQMAGIRNALVMSEDPVKIADKWSAIFDKVLVDAPCSGEGMFRKEPKLVSSWLSSGPEDFVEVQRSILSSADRLLKAGGVLVYSTCTYNLDENEKNIRWFLDQHPNYSLDPIAERLGIGQGLEVAGDGSLQGCGRVWPHLHKGEGHFVARLIKGSSEDQVKLASKVQGRIDKEAQDAIVNFAREVGIDSNVLPLDRLNRIKDTIYLLPEEVLDTKGLRVFANGWLLGTMKRGRFEPSQAFASGLAQEDVQRIIVFKEGHDQSVRYLKGETLAVEAPNGWHLVTIEGKSLGWGKVVNNRLKNKLEPSWRWQ